VSKRNWATAVAVAAGVLAVPASVSAAVKTIYASAPPTYAKQFEALPAEANAFYPRKTIIHAGDSVNLVTQAGYNFDIPPKGQGPLPFVTLDVGPPISATDAAGNPFWFNGTDSAGVNPLLFASQGGPTYNGTQRVTTAAFPPSKPRVVKFTKVGKYTVYCDLCSGMKGSIVVVGKKARVPSRKQDAEALNRQVRSALAEAKQLVKSKPPKNVIQAGAGGRSGTEILAMFPKTLRVKVGTVVTARMSARSVDLHTVTFGPDAYLAALLKSSATITAYPSDNPETAQPFPVNATAHGNGFANSGWIRNRTRDLPSSVKFRFTQPGTYKYICFIHPGMTGTVIVK
jgi:plastocyanin